MIFILSLLSVVLDIRLFIIGLVPFYSRLAI